MPPRCLPRRGSRSQALLLAALVLLLLLPLALSCWAQLLALVPSCLLRTPQVASELAELPGSADNLAVGARSVLLPVVVPGAAPGGPGTLALSLERCCALLHTFSLVLVGCGVPTLIALAFYRHRRRQRRATAARRSCRICGKRLEEPAAAAEPPPALPTPDAPCSTPEDGPLLGFVAAAASSSFGSGSNASEAAGAARKRVRFDLSPALELPFLLRATLSELAALAAELASKLLDRLLMLIPLSALVWIGVEIAATFV